MASVGDYPFPLNTYSGSLNFFTTAGTSAGWPAGQPFQFAQPSPQTYIPPYPLPTYIITEPEEKKEPMRGLFEVIIVDPETGGVSVDHIVARDETTAKVKVLTDHCRRTTKDLDEYDYFVRRVGDVRAKKAEKG